MADRTAIRALREAVESGDSISWGYAKAGPRGVFRLDWETAMDAYLGSLDAAVALIEAVLPGWGWQITNLPEAFLEPPRDLRHIGQIYAESARAGLPARALLIATLKAMEAKADG